MKKIFLAALALAPFIATAQQPNQGPPTNPHIVVKAEAPLSKWGEQIEILNRVRYIAANCREMKVGELVDLNLKLDSFINLFILPQLDASYTKAMDTIVKKNKK